MIRWFVPSLENEDKKRVGQLLVIVTTMLIFLSVVFLLTIVLVPSLEADPPLAFGFLMGFALLRFAANQGYLRLASVGTVSLIWIFFTFSAFASEIPGILNPGFSGYILPIVLASVLISSRASIIIVAVSVATGFLIMLVQMHGDVSRLTLVTRWAAESLFFSTTALILALTGGSIRNALERARRDEKSLEERNAQLQQENRERRKAEDSLQAFQEKLKALHELSIELSQITDLNTFYKAAVDAGRQRLGFERIGILMIGASGDEMVGTFGTDVEGKTRNEHYVSLPIVYDSWLTSPDAINDRIRVKLDTELYDNEVVVGRGWNMVVGMWGGEKLVGWIVTDNLITHAPLMGYQPELLSLYASTLGHLVVQKQTEQTVINYDKRLSLALQGARMRSWDLNYETGKIARYHMRDHEQIFTSNATNYADFLEQIHPEDREFVHEHVEGARLESKLYMVEYRLAQPDGEIRWVSSLGNSYTDENGKIIGMIGVSQDITARKTAELQTLELTVQNERMAMLTEFMGNITHDLKTPLTIINTSMYLLERADDPSRRQEKLDQIKDQVAILEKFIQDILTIFRLDYAYELGVQSVDIHAVLRGIENRLHPVAEQKQIKLAFSLDATTSTVTGDTEELNRALVNLVENAVNYTPISGQIQVQTSIDGDDLVISISDTGIGIAAEDITHIFDRFYRTGAARHTYQGGTGLGLAIVKRIIEMHKGKIEVESVVNQGSIFRLRLPRS